jgi:hypothetical protein
MIRRIALQRIALISGAVGLSLGGYSLFRQYRNPSLETIESNMELLGLLVDAIIPATSTPGAKEANVHKFVSKMVIECSNIRDQNTFADGLSGLMGYTKDRFGKLFSECTAHERNQVLEYFEESELTLSGLLGKVQRKILGPSFFHLLKEYTVKGYFTSEIGATISLRYLLVPTKYIPCQDYLHGQKAWATF